MIRSEVSWERLAEPQEDEYDTKVVCEFTRKKRYKYTLFDQAVGDFKKKIPFDNFSPQASFPHFRQTPPNHDIVEKTCGIINTWPQLFIQIQSLIHSIHAFSGTRQSHNKIEFYPMHIKQLFEKNEDLSKVNVVSDNWIYFVRALAGIVAHRKLLLLGIHPDSAEYIIINLPSQIIRSPYKDDILQPITEILHFQYATTYMCALDIKLINSELSTEDERLMLIKQLAIDLPKLQFGFNILQEYAELDSTGVQFFNGYYVWLDKIIHEGTNIMGKYNLSLASIEDTRGKTLKEKLAFEIKQYPRRMDYIVACELQDEIILYSTQNSEKATSLNSSSRMIWERCDGNHTVAQIGNEIAQELDMSDLALISELYADINAFIKQLCKLNLMEITAEPSPVLNPKD